MDTFMPSRMPYFFFTPCSMVSLRRLSFLGALLASLTIPSFAIAAGTGTITIEQTGEGIGSWGLITPNDSIESGLQTFSKQSPAGLHTLTITPPPGGSHTITVLTGGTVGQTTESRTVSAPLAPGGTLTFHIRYVINLVGEVGVVAHDKDNKPIQISFTLKGPGGATYEGVTTQTFTRMPEGSYSIYYKVTVLGCLRDPPPVNRVLRRNERILFNHTSTCIGGQRPGPSPSPSPSPTPSPSPEPVAEPEIRLRLTADRREVSAGGSARVTVAIVNTGEADLSDLELVARFDPAFVSVTGARGGSVAGSQVSFEVAKLPAGRQWKGELVVKAKDGLAGGTSIPLTVTASGDGIKDVSASKKTDSVSLSVIAMLPKTGASLDLLFHIVTVAAFAFALVVSTVARRRKFAEARAKR